ncbi:MAG TPA: hypothetical protein VFQ91_12005 [Bryobacteraceae bacterium]|nr:hypothetical protein [Bryobacteraceae bacterium]
MPTEKRRTTRTAVTQKMQVSYVDEQGRERYELAPALDISAEGCQVLLQYRCIARTVVQIQVTPAVNGSASVRYQRPTPRGYSTGLEFLGGMRVPPAPGAGKTGKD